MKTVIYAILGVLIMNTSEANSGSSFPRQLNQLAEQVRSASVIPVTLRDGVPVFHALNSRSSDVKVTGPGQAEIKLGTEIFHVSLLESEISDGDFYHVQILNVNTGEQTRLDDVLAFGDVLLGVLGGDTRGLKQETLDPALVDAGDANLLKMKF